MIEIDNRTGFVFDKDIIEKITENLTKRPVELIIVDNEEIAGLNKAYRGLDRPTDVISFPFEDTPGAPLGSIVISSQKATEAAQRLGHTPQEEFTLLYIHGLLHLLGYDHETDEGQMRQKEEELIRKYNLPASLIVRNS